MVKTLSKLKSANRKVLMEMRLTDTDNKREKTKSTPFAVITFLRALCPFCNSTVTFYHYHLVLFKAQQTADV